MTSQKRSQMVIQLRSVFPYMTTEHDNYSIVGKQKAVAGWHEASHTHPEDRTTVLLQDGGTHGPQGCPLANLSGPVNVWCLGPSGSPQELLSLACSPTGWQWQDMTKEGLWAMSLWKLKAKLVIVKSGKKRFTRATMRLDDYPPGCLQRHTH